MFIAIVLQTRRKATTKSVNYN